MRSRGASLNIVEYDVPHHRDAHFLTGAYEVVANDFEQYRIIDVHANAGPVGSKAGHVMQAP